MKFEERWCETDAPTCHDIPEWRRVYSAGFKGWETGNITFDSPCATVVMRLRPNGMDGEWMDYTEDLSWQVCDPVIIRNFYRADICFSSQAKSRPGIHGQGVPRCDRKRTEIKHDHLAMMNVPDDEASGTNGDI